MKTYKLEYDYQLIAEVQIEEGEKSSGVIREMVEFWGNWQQRLVLNDRDYTKTWLKQLAIQILHSGAPHKNDEGWVPLDGSHGITLLNWSRYEFDIDFITIEE